MVAPGLIKFTFLCGFSCCFAKLSTRTTFHNTYKCLNLVPFRFETELRTWPGTPWAWWSDLGCCRAYSRPPGCGCGDERWRAGETGYQTNRQSDGISHWLHSCNFCTCDKSKGQQVRLHTDCIHVTSVPVPDMWQVKRQSGGASHWLHTCNFCTCTWNVTNESAIRWGFTSIAYM